MPKPKLPDSDFPGYEALGGGKNRGANEKAGRAGRTTPSGGDPHGSQKMKRSSHKSHKS